MTPFFCNLGTKKTIFESFTKSFSELLDCNLLILIESPNIFHWKLSKKSKVSVVCGTKFGPNLVQCCEKTKKNWYFNEIFDILHEVSIYKHEVMFIETPKWKLKAKSARKNIFEEN